MRLKWPILCRVGCETNMINWYGPPSIATGWRMALKLFCLDVLYSAWFAACIQFQYAHLDYSTLSQSGDGAINLRMWKEWTTLSTVSVAYLAVDGTCYRQVLDLWSCYCYLGFLQLLLFCFINVEQSSHKKFCQRLRSKRLGSWQTLNASASVSRKKPLSGNCDYFSGTLSTNSAGIGSLLCLPSQSMLLRW